PAAERRDFFSGSSLAAALRLGPGKRQPHSGAAVRRRLEAHRAPVSFGNLAYDGETESRAGQAGRGGRAVETGKHERRVLLRDAGAAVAHGDFAVAHDDVDLAARRAPLRGVVEQVRNRALDR